LSNLYHNKLHAADVTQTINFFLVHGDFMQLADLTFLEVASMYISGAIHDYEHP